MLITTDSPKMDYRRRAGEEKKAVHWGQRKLLISEIQFLTLFHDINISNPIIVYAGVAPGTHIKYLQKLFPQCIFHLYDPRSFADGLHNGVTIFTYVQLFRDEDALQWSGRNDVYFISDIRTAEYTKMTEAQVEEFVSADMQL